MSILQVLGAVLLATVPALLTWLLNKHAQRQIDERRRREERYVELLSAIEGYYREEFHAARSIEKRRHFIEQYRLCFLYCPDEVIRKANVLFDTLSTVPSREFSDEDRERAAGDLVMTIRRDLLGSRKTRLGLSEFKTLGTRE